MWGIGRLISFRGRTYLDPHAPGPPSPSWGGRPEPFSSGAVSCEFVPELINHLDSLMSGSAASWVRCEGVWSEEVFHIDQATPSEQQFDHWFCPVDGEFAWADVEQAWSIVDRIPGIAGEQMRSVGIHQRADDTSVGSVIVELVHLSSEWSAFYLTAPPGQLCIYTTLRSVKDLGPAGSPTLCMSNQG